MARHDDRRPHDAAGVGPYAHDDARLRRMSDLDGWEITAGADIRGWAVRTLGGRELGRVKELLVDETLQQAVMAEVDLKDSPAVARVPLRAIEIDRTAKVVRADSADLAPAGALVAGERDADVESGRLRAGERDPDVENARIRAGEHDPDVEEVVVERRPVVYEEVVVRRRAASADVEPGRLDERP